MAPNRTREDLEAEAARASGFAARARRLGRRLVPERVRGVVRVLLPLLQITLAGTAAWIIARNLGDRPEPFFAPIAAVVALSSPIGERGSNALRLVAGVVVAIVAGELTVFVLGGGYGRLALATFSAMALAKLLGGPRLVVVQAAAAAILTVAAADGEAGTDRLVDALIGAGVALLFSQVLFSPEPVALVRRAGSRSLAQMARSLALTAEALDRQEPGCAEEAMDVLRAQRDDLVELARLREASGRVARRSAIWRSRITPVVQENENLGHLDLLDASCIQLARAVATEAIGSADPDTCERMAGGVRRLAGVLEVMAADLGDRAARQAGADEALDVARRMVKADLPAEAALRAAWVALEAVIVDVMVVAGVDVSEAEAVARAGTGELVVPSPPTTPRLPFVSERERRRRPRPSA